MIYLTEQDVHAACDEANDARGYTEANALAAILERMILENQAKAGPVAWEWDTPVNNGTWRGNLGYEPPKVPVGYKNLRPLYLHPAPAPEGMVMAVKALLEKLPQPGSRNFPCYHANTELKAVHDMIAAAEKERPAPAPEGKRFNATKVAAQILTYLGYAQEPSMEPGADTRRDTVALMIEAAAEKEQSNDAN